MKRRIRLFHTFLTIILIITCTAICLSVRPVTHSAGETTQPAFPDNPVTPVFSLSPTADAVPVNVDLSAEINAAVTHTYGQSYLGRDLTAYIFNPNGDKTILLIFAVHAFEGGSFRDGMALTACAQQLRAYYTLHPEDLNDWRLVLVPCANPDGLYEGVNELYGGAGAFGRCTYDHVDINRDWHSFQAAETRALRDLMNNYPPDICIDFHGWLDTAIGDPEYAEIFQQELGLSDRLPDQYGSTNGYMIGYTYYTLGARSVLVEFKQQHAADSSRVCSALRKILQKR